MESWCDKDRLETSCRSENPHGLIVEEFSFSVNGDVRKVRTDGRRPLLDVLREAFGLTGVKYGCGEGQCRACTVLIDGRATPSCLTPVSEVAGSSIVTIEGLSQGDALHPVQQAFLEADAMQCGYCVPGMILTAAALLERNARPSDAAIVEGMNGNLCRCCGYPNILKAVRIAAGPARCGADRPRRGHADRLQRGGNRSGRGPDRHEGNL